MITVLDLLPDLQSDVSNVSEIRLHCLCVKTSLSSSCPRQRSHSIYLELPLKQSQRRKQGLYSLRLPPPTHFLFLFNPHPSPS